MLVFHLVTAEVTTSFTYVTWYYQEWYYRWWVVYRGRSRQDTCPVFTSNWNGEGSLPNPVIVTVDYGNGCKDEEGDFFRGSVKLTFYEPRIDEEGDLIASGLRIDFNDFGDDEETNDGTFILSETDTPLVYRLSYDLGYSNIDGCDDREIFNGTVRTDAPVINDEFTRATINGTGTYSGPSGNFSLVMMDLLFTEDCDYPVDGTLKVVAGNAMATVKFSSECGRMTVVVNGGAPSAVLLPELEEDDPDDPCF